ncbi:MAG: 5'/3'-nucleotidase SurE [Anaerolineales bacterium]|nr:5'/3'-nucleotidase SurE [Anaerolineales bacterium]
MTECPLIILTNDDGIDSPGLAAAAAALDPLGELVIIAPARQQTSMGRSRSSQHQSDSNFSRHDVAYNGKHWEGFAVDASPAVTLELGLHALLKRPAALVVSGINYGENVGSCVTISGTIGAALEAADYGLKTMAVSLEINSSDYHSYDQDVDFETAAAFTRMFARSLLLAELPPDVDVLKIEIPAAATINTPWIVSRQDRIPYYKAGVLAEGNQERIPTLRHFPRKGEYYAAGTDAFALADGVVSITPLSLDMTSRVSLDQLKNKIMEGIAEDENQC